MSPGGYILESVTPPRPSNPNSKPNADPNPRGFMPGGDCPAVNARTPLGHVLLTRGDVMRVAPCKVRCRLRHQRSVNEIDTLRNNPLQIIRSSVQFQSNFTVVFFRVTTRLQYIEDSEQVVDGLRNRWCATETN